MGGAIRAGLSGIGGGFFIDLLNDLGPRARTYLNGKS